MLGDPLHVQSIRPLIFASTLPLTWLLLSGPQISFPGQNKDKSNPVPGVAAPQSTSAPTTNPVSAVPKKLLTKTKRALSEADLTHSALEKTTSPQKSSGAQATDGEQTAQAPPPKSSLGSFHTVSHYMKLFEVMKGAYGNYQVKLSVVIWPLRK